MPFEDLSPELWDFMVIATLHELERLADGEGLEATKYIAVGPCPLIALIDQFLEEIDAATHDVRRWHQLRHAFQEAEIAWKAGHDQAYRYYGHLGQHGLSREPANMLKSGQTIAHDQPSFARQRWFLVGWIGGWDAATQAALRAKGKH
jgi:hypothetical protein